MQAILDAGITTERIIMHSAASHSISTSFPGSASPGIKGLVTIHQNSQRAGSRPKGEIFHSTRMNRD
jgi:hypothetical protein